MLLNSDDVEHIIGHYNDKIKSIISSGKCNDKNGAFIAILSCGVDDFDNVVEKYLGRAYITTMKPIFENLVALRKINADMVK